VQSAGEHLRIDLRPGPDRVVLGLCGELDLASAPLLESELENAVLGPSSTIVLDLNELGFIDSTGLRTILSAHERARERGGQLLLTGCSEQVKRLLSIAGVSERLRTITSPDGLLV
jgi:anti-sigma B factor antagonist